MATPATGTRITRNAPKGAPTATLLAPNPLAPLGAALVQAATAAAGAAAAHAARAPGATKQGQAMPPAGSWQVPAALPASKPRSPSTWRTGTVPHVVCTMGAGIGSTLGAMQLAVNALGLQGTHPVQNMLRRLAALHGYTVTCTNGVVQVAYVVGAATPAQ